LTSPFLTVFYKTKYSRRQYAKIQILHIYIRQKYGWSKSSLASYRCKEEDFNKKPIIAVVNSYTQFVPGHVHLREIGKMMVEEIEKAGGIAKEMNTIAIDDGIAMGHNGMLYSLPSRELIADSVEYMLNAHCADAMVCISNCDKSPLVCLWLQCVLIYLLSLYQGAYGSRQGIPKGENKKWT